MPAPAAFLVLLCLALLTGCHASDATVTAGAFPGAGPPTYDEPETRVRLTRIVAADWSRYGCRRSMSVADETSARRGAPTNGKPDMRVVHS